MPKEICDWCGEEKNCRDHNGEVLCNSCAQELGHRVNPGLECDDDEGDAGTDGDGYYRDEDNDEEDEY